jgi:predicted nucleic acid-binding protein
MKDKNEWDDVSELLIGYAPLLSALLSGKAAKTLGYLLAYHLEVSSDPEAVFEEMSKNKETLEKAKNFENVNANKLKMMLFTQMQLDVGDSYSNKDESESEVGYFKLSYVGAIVAVVILLTSVIAITLF